MTFLEQIARIFSKDIHTFELESKIFECLFYTQADKLQSAEYWRDLHFEALQLVQRDKASLLDQLADRDDTIKQLESLAPCPPPVIYGEINLNDVKGLVIDTIPKFNTLKIPDIKFQVTTRAEMRRFLAYDLTNILMTWAEHWPDCDDFTRRLLGQLTVPGWWSIPKGDCWFYKMNEDHSGYLWGHSELIVIEYDNEVDKNLCLDLIEGQLDIIELARNVFEDNDIIADLIKF